MPLRAVDNPLVLPVLGLLAERPRPQYALLADLRARHGPRARTSSVYTLVASLRAAGWVEQAPGAHRPPVFRATGAGAAEFRRRLAADLADSGAADFTTALAYVGALDRSAATAALTARAEALERQAESLERALSAAEHPSRMVDADFTASRARHDAAWLRAFLARPWPW